MFTNARDISHHQTGKTADRYRRIKIKTDNADGGGQVQIFPWFLVGDFRHKSQGENDNDKYLSKAEFPRDFLPFWFKLKVADSGDMGTIAHGLCRCHGGHCGPGNSINVIADDKIVGYRFANKLSPVIGILYFFNKGRCFLVIQRNDFMYFGIIFDTNTQDKGATIALALLDENILSTTGFFFANLENYGVIIYLGKILALKLGLYHGFVIFSFRGQADNKSRKQGKIGSITNRFTDRPSLCSNWLWAM